MKKGYFLKLFLITLALIIILFVAFVVDFNLIAVKSYPKFCFKIINHSENATEYIGIGYKIIRYQINEDEQKLKVGSLFLNYDPSYIGSFSQKIDVEGYIKEIKYNSGVYVIYVESNKFSTSKYTYEKAYATVSNETNIKDVQNNKECKKTDLKVGQFINLTYIGNVQEIYPVRGTAGIINILQNVKDGGDNDE